MMQELAVVHTEQISRKGEIKYFQIPLPGTIKNIIAVEASCMLFTLVAPIVQEPLTNTAATNNSSNNNTTTNATTSNNCPNPGKATIDPVSENVTGGIRTQVFKIGAAVNPGFIYECGVYSVVVSITAVDGDTPSTIASKLADAVNTTTLATWNQFGSNNNNYKPGAIANADQITLKVDNQHSFYAAGIGECYPAPPPPPPPAPNPLLQYDLLFFVRNNEKAGVLSLQSPDATDIFYQSEVFREDNNISFGDFTVQNMMNGEWLKGKKRFAPEISITTASPILEAYYKDHLGVWYNKDLSYQLSIFIWYQKEVKDDK